MAISINARDLRRGDLIHFGGARAHVIGVREDGALVVVLIEEVGAVTFDGAHPVTLLARPKAENADRSALRRLRTRETRLNGVQNHSRNIAAAA